MEKIKAIDPKIVVSGSADKPYYSIEYYNISDKRWHIGYGSYNLKFVKEWLNDDFETVEADIVPVHHGHWNIGYFHDRVCSCCLHPDNDLNDYAHSYCPNCGAKMDDNKVE